MKQYLAKLMFNIHIEDGGNNSQFDEQIRLIESKSFETAFQKARSIGKHEETVFLNQGNKKVSWRFIDVVELFPLQEFKDGEQLFSVTHEEQNVSSFINYIREKSMQVQVKSLTFG
jgi:uncharacterized protein DUF4288